MIECTCRVCGKKFFKKPSNADSKYCGRDCQYKSQERRIERTCQVCGKKFYLRPSRIKDGQGRGKFCSYKCMGIANSNKVECTCYNCGKKFYVKPAHIKNGIGKCCSSKCMGEYKQKKVARICKSCGKTFYVAPSTIKHGAIYCSAACYDRSLEKNPAWKGGISYEPYCPKFNEEFKERVRAFFGHKCFMCGEPQNGVKLSVHHVDYDKRVCCNDNIPLFVPLCRKHHNRTNVGDRELWSAYFRMSIHQHTGGTMKTFYSKNEYNIA